MRSSHALITTPEVAVHEVVCRDDHTGWSEPEPAGGAQIVLVRRGRFRMDAEGRTLAADPTTGYLQGPGAIQRFAHPAGGDVCTSISLKGHALTAEPWLDDAVRSPTSHEIRVDARLELAHRLLLRADAGGVDEAVLTLLDLALRGQRRRTPSPGPGRAELARLAREAIVAGEPGSDRLVPLARSLGTSPSHLSRTFRHHIGMSVTRYRNRIRISRALQRIEAGETDLARLAYELGFSDQAHFTRVLRAELGRTPDQVRSLLVGDGKARQALRRPRR
ncbi:helix-turn-helix transcriptional regulator [Actinomadura sp. NBRC 104412]|uniref:helix-turn-helix transcriptional regulator n=1 Tax=Actinomadura sp. NBRC 104412 TaxID=3032203 RepID=UPI00255798B7|nr:helix-turn-helix transcriptional regulator [Actinomadura sp. NBRC 104412]